MQFGFDRSSQVEKLAKDYPKDFSFARERPVSCRCLRRRRIRVLTKLVVKFML